jgi:hypothetical protein
MKRAVLLSALAVCSLALAAVAAGQPSAPQPRFTEQDFARLKWIEGQWVGSGYSKPFYEAYRMVSPTKLEIQHFEDASFTKSTGGRSVNLDGGRILYNGGSSQRAAVRLTDTSVEFEQVDNAANGFSWTRKSPDAWTAVIKAKGRADTVYEMTRAKKSR